MLNVKALSWALALTAALAFCVYVAYGLMVPAEYNPVFGGWLPGLQHFTPTLFLVSLLEVVVAAVFLGWVIGTLNNFFHRRWEVTHAH